MEGPSSRPALPGLDAYDDDNGSAGSGEECEVLPPPPNRREAEGAAGGKMPAEMQQSLGAFFTIPASTTRARERKAERAAAAPKVTVQENAKSSPAPTKDSTRTKITCVGKRKCPVTMG